MTEQAQEWAEVKEKGVDGVMALLEGPGRNCICPKCGKSIPHQRGANCYDPKMS